MSSDPATAGSGVCGSREVQRPVQRAPPCGLRICKPHVVAAAASSPRLHYLHESLRIRHRSEHQRHLESPVLGRNPRL